jgi:hypothetical protein
MPQLRVVAQLTTKPGSEEIIREALAKLAAATQSHRGCAEFKLYESATAPEPTPGSASHPAGCPATRCFRGSALDRQLAVHELGGVSTVTRSAV